MSVIKNEINKKIGNEKIKRNKKIEHNKVHK